MTSRSPSPPASPIRGALVTLAIGDCPEFHLSHELFRRYAARHDLELVLLRERKIRRRIGWFGFGRHRYDFEKFQVGSLLSHYPRVIYVDGDVLISAACPDLLALVPPDRLGCVYEDRGPLAWKRREELARAERQLGSLPQPPAGYFNAGVLVLGPAHRELFDLAAGPVAGGRWPEQTTLNYRVARDRVPVEELPAEYNLVAEFTERWHDADRRRQAYLIHYAGKESRGRMAEDYPVIRGGWERDT